MKKDKNTENSSAFIIFKTEDESVSVDVRFDDETVWLTQDQMAMLFDKAKSTISEHIKHIFEEGELEESAVVRKFRTTAGYDHKADVSIAFFKKVQNKIPIKSNHERHEKHEKIEKFRVFCAFRGKNFGKKLSW
jgi:hypothetical protein